MSAPRKKARKASSRGHALVVEDEALVAMMVEEILSDAGFAKVTLSRTTDEALATLREAMPDLVMLDVHLADRDDGWAIAELLEEAAPRRPRIIFATGTPQDIPERIKEMGPVLAKPYTTEELVALLDRPRARSGILSRLRGR